MFYRYVIDKPNRYRVIRNDSEKFFEVFPYPNGCVAYYHRDGFVIRTKFFADEDKAVKAMWKHVEEFGINRRNAPKQIITI